MFHSLCAPGRMYGLRRPSVAVDPHESQSSESRFCTMSGTFHPSGNVWAVREEAHSSSVSPVSCVTKRVEDIVPALQAYYARTRELRCVATEIVQEPGSSLDLLTVQDCTEQYALAMSDDKLRALLADQPTIFRADVPPFAWLRSGSTVKDVTLHIWREVVLCWWLLFVRSAPPKTFWNLVLPVHSRGRS